MSLKRTACLTSLLISLVLAAGGAVATFAAAPEPQSRLATIKSELAAADKEIAALKAQKLAADKDSKGLSNKLVTIASQVQAVEQSSQKIDILLDELNHSIADKEEALNEQEADKQATIAALTRLTRRPDTIELDDSAPLINRVRAAAVMRQVVPSIESQAAEIAVELSALSREKAVQEEAQQKLAASRAVLKDKRATLARLVEEKQAAQNELNKSLERTTAKVDALRHEARDLEDLLGKIEQTRQQKAAAKENRPHLRSLGFDGPPSGPRPHLRSMKIKPAAPQKAAKKPVDQSADPVTRDALSYSGDFAAQKGHLKLPARGRLTVGYGTRPYRGAAPQEGISLQVALGAQITASAPGKVVYAGPFRSLGGLVIINVGQGYHMLIAGLAQIDVALGQTLLAGEPIGIVAPQSGHTDQSNSGPDNKAPALYVEIRRDGKPINPAYWFTRDERHFAGLL